MKHCFHVHHAYNTSFVLNNSFFFFLFFFTYYRILDISFSEVVAYWYILKSIDMVGLGDWVYSLLFSAVVLFKYVITLFCYDHTQMLFVSALILVRVLISQVSLHIFLKCNLCRNYNMWFKHLTVSLIKFP